MSGQPDDGDLVGIGRRLVGDDDRGLDDSDGGCRLGGGGRLLDERGRLVDCGHEGGLVRDDGLGLGLGDDGRLGLRHDLAEVV